jgi:hypothetical protein
MNENGVKPPASSMDGVRERRYLTTFNFEKQERDKNRLCKGDVSQTLHQSMLMSRH